MKIAIIGTHGVGKTTLAGKFFLYALEKGRNAKLIHEVARDCPLGINENFCAASCTWILAEQIKREMEAHKKGANMIICDRSSIDPFMYLQDSFNDGRNSIIATLHAFALEWLKTYYKIIWISPSGLKIIDDGVRCIDIEIQSNIDANFSQQLEKLDIFENIICLNSRNLLACDTKSLFERLCT